VKPPRPPRLAEILLTHVLPSESREAILGDLREELIVRRTRGTGVFRSTAWYWVQAMAIVGRYAVTGATDWNGFGSDVRVSLRQLRRDPSFTVVAAGALALGVGVNALILTLAAAIFLDPLPYPEAERLVLVDNDFSGSATNGFGVSLLNMQEVEARNRVLDEMALFLDWQDVNLSGSEAPERVPANFVDHGYFRLLGMEVARGRTFMRDDNRRGAARPVAILSHGAWVRLFGSNPDVVGHAVQLNGQPFEVIGVMRPGKVDLRSRALDDTDIFLPLWSVPDLLGYEPAEDRGFRMFTAIVKLRPGVDLAEARADFRALSTSLATEYAEANQGYTYNLRPLGEAFFQNHRAPTAVLLVGAGLVLLLVTVNVVNLMLIRATGRTREIAMRRALGARPGRLVRQLLTEGLVLGAIGGVVGTVIAGWGVGLLTNLELLELPGFTQLRLDGPALLLTGVVTVALGTALGLASAVGVLGGTPSDRLRGGGRHSEGRSGIRMRSLLIMSEMALAFVLLVGAGLLVQSFRTLQDTGYGFDTADLVTVHLNLRGERYDEESPRRAVAEALVAGAESLPDVEEAFLWSPNRLGHGNWVELLTDEARYEAFPEERVEASRHHVYPGTFQRLGMELIRGRDFASADDEGSRQVAIVSESLAEWVWPGEDPIGRRYEAYEDGILQPFEVVGVVSDARHRTRLFDPFGPQLDVYRPYSQLAERALTIGLRMRADVDASSLAAQLRAIVRNTDADLPVYDVASMDQRMRDEEARSRLSAVIVALYAGLALALSALGIYGVLAHAVRRQTREIGIKKALGASVGEVMRSVIRHGLTVSVAGAAVGLIGALAAARLLGAVLYGVAPWDVTVFGAVTAVLLAVAVAACSLPALRAARVSPTEALRED
jgi:putative ABC transport system permease protein